MAEAPNFSADRVRPYPWASLRRLTRVEAIAESVLAHWLAASPSPPSASSLAWPRIRALLRLEAAATIAIDTLGARASTIATQTPDDPHAMTRAAGAQPFMATAHAIDPHAAACHVLVGGEAIEVRGSSLAVRAIVQRLLGGPDELSAPRPLGPVERSLWALVVATALEDLGIAGQVWPEPVAGISSVHARPMKAATSAGRSLPAFGFEIRIGDIPLVVDVGVPATLALRAPRAHALAASVSDGRSQLRSAWLDRVHFDVPIVVGRSAVHRDELARLAVRSVVTLERPVSRMPLELEIFAGGVGLRAGVGAARGLAAEVATGYVPRDMSLPDDAHVELTVALGTTQLSLRQITELAVGQVVQLGRPLGGPFELRAGGRVLGRGELVDVDGELAVRIVTLGQ